MEHVAALLTALLVWGFVLHCLIDARGRAYRRAGQLLLKLERPKARRHRAVASIAVGLGTSLYTAMFFMSGVPAGAFVGVVMLLTLSLLPWMLLRNPEFRDSGILSSAPLCAKLFPWDSIRCCKWSATAGTLLVVCDRQMAVFRVHVCQVEPITSILVRRVELRDASNRIVNPEFTPSRAAAQSGGTADLRAPRAQSPRFQFGLRTLLLLMLVASSGFGWLAIWERKSRPSRRERQILEELHVHEPEVGYHLGRVCRLQFLGPQPTQIDEDLALLKELLGLEGLTLSETPTTDAGLVHLAKLTSLESLDLDGTQVTDAGLVHLARLTRLKSLDLDGTQVTDAGLAHLARLTNLESLDLGGTQTTDAGLVHLERLTSLEYLELDGSQITDAGLVHLERLPNLHCLDLSSTQITDAGLMHLQGLPGLRCLCLYETKVSDAGVESLQHALPETTISY